MKFITWVSLIFLSFYSFAQDDTLKTKVLEPEAMQADFNYLVRLLKETYDEGREKSDPSTTICKTKLFQGPGIYSDE